MNVVLFTNIPSPFMLDLAKRLNQFEDLNYYVCFCEDTLEDRGTHWKDERDYNNKSFFYKKSMDFNLWLTGILNETIPNIVITGYNHGNIFNLLSLNKFKYNYKLGKWNEPPPIYKRVMFLRWLRQKYLRILWKDKVDFLLAIGNEAEKEFRRYINDPLKIFFFPYQLEIKVADKPKQIDDKIIFLFSGRLLKRNNIRNLTTAFLMLSKKYPQKFTWLISASGPEENFIRKTSQDKEFANHLEFDNEFKEWDDRLRPFNKSHVLVVPAFHSGWGLVIHEALALGLPVITTRMVGSAEYLIEHMINGVFINTSSTSIFHALEYFILKKNEIYRMSKNALMVKNYHNIDIGAQQLFDILNNINNLDPK